jgi:predicted Zn finger-like uncharacterized protein
VQAQCPECTTRFQLDDSKVPEHPFKVRCPRCQHVVVLAGKGADAPAAAPAPPASPAADAAAPPPPPAAPAPPQRPPKPVKREHTGPKDAEDALVAIADEDLAKKFTEALARLEYNVDVAEDPEEGSRLLEQGVYAIAVTARGNRVAGQETLAQRILRLPPDMRRRVFVVLAGDEFQTADGIQAWAVMVDLVVNSADAETCDGFIRATLGERKRLYQPYLDARRRIEED